MQVPVRDIKGEIVDHIEIRDDVFAVPFHQAVVHQAMIRQLANARAGTAATKTRGEVAGSTRKLFRQKHTGRARRGDIKAPLLRGGGVVFGPHPRSYKQRMPKKMRRLALRCLLSSKAAAGELIVVDKFPLEQPRTKEMVGILRALGAEPPALIATLKPDTAVIKSARNLKRVKTLPAALLNVVDLLNHRFLIITRAGIREVERLWGSDKSAVKA
jgi:large subunit ribosomal protein L4